MGGHFWNFEILKKSRGLKRNVTIYYKQKHAKEDLIWSHWAFWDGVTIRTWNQETLTILQTSTGGSLRYILGLIRWGLRVEYSNLLRGPRWAIVDKNTSGWLYTTPEGWIPNTRHHWAAHSREVTGGVAPGAVVRNPFLDPPKYEDLPIPVSYTHLTLPTILLV